MRIVPISLKIARQFVKDHHRHNKPPVGHKFSIGLELDWGLLVGVASAGRPVARHFDDGLTLEVNRTCVVGTPNANSMLYGAVWRAAKAMGYKRCITYTQHGESGSSLRGAGWVKVKVLAGHNGWNRDARPRDDDANGSVGIERVLWEITR